MERSYSVYSHENVTAATFWIRNVHFLAMNGLSEAHGVQDNYAI